MFTDVKNFLVFILLASVLRPSIIKEKTTTVKPTIIDSQNSLAVFVEVSINILQLYTTILRVFMFQDKNEVASFIADRKKKCYKC